ncbi:hypothetical protein [Nocardia blacklockiae]|uniref:hypothetical protein n=1 Tax=Nocardia blacklockiae TaxID=480036 RepID=UPI0018949539|nr:hypothetical protein [Nocardia blacklockiae]MBF6171291.1 hypothetical protein [Nocardia blacklockiae]
MTDFNPAPIPEESDDLTQQACELADLLKVTPPGDHPIVAEHLGNGVIIYVAGAMHDIKEMVDVHHDMAPVAAHRVMTFVQQVSRDTMEWIKQWAQE